MTKLPVHPQLDVLPFDSKEFNYSKFESFISDFVAVGRRFTDAKDKKCNVVNVKLYGTSGYRQKGIDVLAEMNNGETWVFQCKHVRKWTRPKTIKEIKKCPYPAERKFLVIACEIEDPAIVEEIRCTPGWSIWDKKDLSRMIRFEFETHLGKKLVRRIFGPKWIEPFFGTPENADWVPASDFYANQLERTSLRHHRLPLIGRKTELNWLDAFVQSSSQRILILSGEWGVGKSRLLLEWARNQEGMVDTPKVWFTQLHPNTKPPDSDEGDACMVLVVEQCEPEYVRSSFISTYLKARPKLKLILVTRWTKAAELCRWATNAGFELNQIDEKQLETLPVKQHSELIEKALGASNTLGRCRAVWEVSDNSPLIAMLAANYFKNIETQTLSLFDTKEFKHYVVEPALEEIAKDGDPLFKDLLALIALLQPFSVNEHIHSHEVLIGRMARVLESKENDVRERWERLKRTSLIHMADEEVLIRPAILADSIALHLICPEEGVRTRLINRIFAEFGKTVSRPMALNLARVGSLASAAPREKIIEPLIRVAREELANQETQNKFDFLYEWAPLASWLPKNTIEVIEEILRCSNNWTDESKATGASVGKAVELLCKAAVSDACSIPKALDLSLEIIDAYSAENHEIKGRLLNFVKEVASYTVYKRVEVYENYLQWVLDKSRTPCLLKLLRSTKGTLEMLLRGFFDPRIIHSWKDGDVLRLSTIQIDLEESRKLRTKALEICERILQLNDDQLCVEVIQVLCAGVECVHFRLVVTKENSVDLRSYQHQWLEERLNILPFFERILKQFTNPVIAYRIHNGLRRYLNAKSKDAVKFKESVERTLGLISQDSLGFTLTKAVFSNGLNEFVGPNVSGSETDLFDSCLKRWDKWLENTAIRLLNSFSDPIFLLKQFKLWHEQWNGLGNEPRFAPVYAAIGRLNRSMGLELANELISNTGHPHSNCLADLIYEITKNSEHERMVLWDRAMTQPSESIQQQSVRLLSWWRCKGEFPTDGWDRIRRLAHGTPESARFEILKFVREGFHCASNQDWELLAILEVNRHERDLAVEILDVGASLLTRLSAPRVEIVRSILSKLEQFPKLNGLKFDEALRRFHESFAAEVYVTDYRRAVTHQNPPHNGNSRYEPWNIPWVPKPNIDLLKNDELRNIREDTHHSIQSGGVPTQAQADLLRALLFKSGTSPTEGLHQLVNYCHRREQIEWVSEFIADWDGWPLTITEPKLTKLLLNKARKLDKNCYESVFDRLKRIPSPKKPVGWTDQNSQLDWHIKLEQNLHEYGSDSELGPLYKALMELRRRPTIDRIASLDSMTFA